MTEGLSRETRALLQRAVAEERPADGAQKRRIRAALSASLGAGLAATVAGTAGAAQTAGQASLTGAAATLLVGTPLKVVVGLALIGGTSVAVWSQSGAPAPAQGSRLVAAPRLSAAAPAAPQLPASESPGTAPAVASVASASALPPPPAHRPLPAPGGEATPGPTLELKPAAAGSGTPARAAFAPLAPEGNDPAAELQSLRRAQEALRDRRAEEALRHLEGAASTGQPGQLEEEREATRVRALCASGRRDEARLAAANFLSRWPQSHLSSRVREICAVDR